MIVPRSTAAPVRNPGGIPDSLRVCRMAQDGIIGQREPDRGVCSGLRGAEAAHGDRKAEPVIAKKLRI